MNPFDYGPALARSFAALWSGDTEAFAKAQGEAGQAFADGLKSMAAPGPELDLAAATDSLAKLWQSASTLSSALASRLPQVMSPPGLSPPSVPHGPADAVDAVFRRMMDPGTWLTIGTGDMHDALGRMAEGPRFADLWDMERRYARVTAAWLALRRASLEHNAVALEAWMRAGKTLSARLAERKDKQPDHRALLALWTEIANGELIATQRSEPYLATQSAMIRATTDLRVAQQDLAEQAGKQYGFPTRTELDDVHRTVTHLKRELRALRRELRDRPAQAPAPAAPPPDPAGRPKSPRTPARRKP